METDTGATVWTDGAKSVTQIAGGSLNGRGHGRFGATDPEAVYGEMIDGLVYEVTDAFRVQYITRRVPRTLPRAEVQVEVAPPPAVATVEEPEAVEEEE
jgi:hypothetical protein